MRLPVLSCAVAALLLPAFPAAKAADGPVGIAFAQAEEGTFFCRDADAPKAFSCALRQCRETTGGQGCVATRWCTPAGWSGTMVGWLPEFHATQVVCGVGSAEAVRAALQAMCENTPEYSRCDLLSVIDPDGKVTRIDDVSWPGPLVTPPSSPEETPPQGNGGVTRGL